MWLTLNHEADRKRDASRDKLSKERAVIRDNLEKSAATERMLKLQIEELEGLNISLKKDLRSADKAKTALRTLAENCLIKQQSTLLESRDLKDVIIDLQKQLKAERNENASNAAVINELEGEVKRLVTFHEHISVISHVILY